MYRCLSFINRVDSEHAMSPSAVIQILDNRMHLFTSDCLCSSAHAIFCCQCWEKGGREVPGGEIRAL